MTAKIEHCEACGRERERGVTEDWTWIWLAAATQALCFCPTCSAKLPPPSEDTRPAS